MMDIVALEIGVGGIVDDGYSGFGDRPDGWYS